MLGRGAAAMHPRRVRRRGLHPHCLYLPAMPHDQVEADQLASSHVAGPNNRAAFSSPSLRRVWWSVALGQAVATGGRAWEAAWAARIEETAVNDKTAVFVRSFPVGKHIVTMTLTRRSFLAGRISCRWSPPRPRRLTKEERHEYRSGRAAAVADAYGSMRGRFGLIIER